MQIRRHSALLAWRVTDTLLALILLVYFAPLMVLIGLMIWFKSGRPIVVAVADPRQPDAPLLRRFRVAPSRLPLPRAGTAPARRPPWIAAGGLVTRMRADRLPGLLDVLAGRVGLLNPHLPGLFG